MRLTSKGIHLSIGRDFPPSELPDFTVVTGANGSGKTHLLCAIENEAVVVAQTPRSKGRILRFDSEKFHLMLQMYPTGNDYQQHHSEIVRQITRFQEEAIQSIQNFMSGQMIWPHHRFTDILWATTATDEELAEELKNCSSNYSTIDQAKAKELVPFIRSEIERANEIFISNVDSSTGFLSSLLRKAEKLNIPVLALSQLQIVQSLALVLHDNGILQGFSEWFTSWYRAYETNKFNRYCNTQLKDKHRWYFEDKEFFETHGEAPWETANDVLESAGFRFRMVPPSPMLFANDTLYTPELKSLDDGLTVAFSQLSTGEAMLLSITLLLRRFGAGTETENLPRIVLLDEPDAPLHPSFTKILLDTLKKEFVEERKVAVIMTTHSPSTVALAPKDSVYELVRKPRELRPIATSVATQILSEGFVSVTPNDIIVITESSVDASYYNSVYAALCKSGDVLPEPPLSFIGASKLGDDGVGGGYSQVMNWAPKLTALGLERFKGLVDGDGNNLPSSVVKVLRRYCMENYLFDPLTLAASLINCGFRKPFENCLSGASNTTDFLALDTKSIQQAMDVFYQWIATLTGESKFFESEKEVCEYMGIVKLEVPCYWLKESGKQHVKLLRSKFQSTHAAKKIPFLKKGELEKEEDFQTVQFPSLISKDLKTIFTSLHEQQ